MAHLTASLQQLGVATRQCWDRGDTGDNRGAAGDTRSCVEEEVRLGRAVVGLLLPATLQLDMDMQDRVTVYQVIITVMLKMSQSFFQVHL